MRRTARFAAVYIALSAMFLRALVPAGWMPADIASGAPLTICTMQGAVEIASDHQQPKHDGTHHNEICPFAAAPNLSSPIIAAAIAPQSFAVETAETASIALAPPGDERQTPQSPRAPPALA